MGKNRDREQESQISTVEEIIGNQTEVVSQPPISSKQFVQKLKDEIKGISQDVLNAFISISPKIDMEENYRKVWDTTFKRK